MKDSDPDKAYLFFDIGNFASNLGPVYNLADETGSDTYGEEKRLALVVDDLAWAHFDLFALLTDTQEADQPRNQPGRQPRFAWT